MRLKVPQAYKSVLQSIRRKANRCGVTIHLKPQRIIYQGDWDKSGSSGFYGDNELWVGIDNKFHVWMSVMIHESCHMDQQFDKKLKEKCIEWQRAYNQFYSWLEGLAIYNKAQLLNMVRLIIECEKDCDQRAIAKIKKHKVPIDRDWYIRSSNVYLYSYYLVMDTRKWYDQIYTDEMLLASAPNHYNGSYSNIPARLCRAMYKFIEKFESKSAA